MLSGWKLIVLIAVIVIVAGAVGYVIKRHFDGIDEMRTKIETLTQEKEQEIFKRKNAESALTRAQDDFNEASRELAQTRANDRILRQQIADYEKRLLSSEAQVQQRQLRERADVTEFLRIQQMQVNCLNDNLSKPGECVNGVFVPLGGQPAPIPLAPPPSQGNAPVVTPGLPPRVRVGPSP